jgi:glucosamine--fructose-6-phosphate aminotransferase (isomerizing)
MLREAREAPRVVARQLADNRPAMASLARCFARRRPRFVATCARGSSHNAAIYAKYLIETRLGVPVLTAAPSVGALYRAPVDLRGALLLCISQSGESFDLVENARWARARGARVVSLLNTSDSPLGEASDVVVPLGAGPESSIPATKSHIATLSATLQLVAYLGGHSELLGLLDGLPDQLDRASRLDWSRAAPVLAGGPGTFVVGRGLGAGAA